jgi:predicted RNA-binding protein with PUA-like domain
MNYWLVKSEPFKYSWNDLVKDKWTYWDGVRNYGARNFLKQMLVGDLVLYYHSNEGLEVVGYAKVIKSFYQDPTTDDDRWVAVDIEPVHPLANPVSLKMIKADKKLENMRLIKQSRLSVMPVTAGEFNHVLKLGGK